MKNFCSKRFGFWFYFALLFCAAGMAFGTDWSQWGGTPSRNMVATGVGKLPCWFSPGVTDDQGEFKPGSTANVGWVAKTHGKCASPIVSQGRIIVDELFCLDFATGALLWRGAKGVPNGYSATATIDGDRVYTVTSKGVILCLDLFSEKKGAKEGIVIWSYDMKKLGVFLKYPASSSPLIIGDYLYVGTGNERLRTCLEFCPLAPSLIALNKRTGQLVARDDEQMGAHIYKGQWSSPSSGVVNGQTQIYYGNGDGVCYAFEPVDPSAKVTPDQFITTKLRHQPARFIIQKGSAAEILAAKAAAIEEMKKIEQATGIPVGEVLMTRGGDLPTVVSSTDARVPDVPCLKKIWSADCNPKEYKEDASGMPVPRGCVGCPNSAISILATPVFYKNKVYVALGRDANEGLQGGNLVCIDATRKGDMKSGEWLWSHKINRSASTVAVADGLVYAVDFGATVYCFDAETGKKYWEYLCVADPSSGWAGVGHCYASPLVADGKLYIRTLKKLFVFATGREARLLGKVDISGGDEGYATPCAVGNTLFVSSGKQLWAVEDKGAVTPAPK